MTWLTAMLGPKGQITIPKEVRLALGIADKGNMVGFLLDERSGRVELAKMVVSPSNDNYTEQELRQLLKISCQKGGKHFETGKDFLKNLEGL